MSSDTTPLSDIWYQVEVFIVFILSSLAGSQLLLTSANGTKQRKIGMDSRKVLFFNFYPCDR